MFWKLCWSPLALCVKKACSSDSDLYITPWIDSPLYGNRMTKQGLQSSTHITNCISTCDGKNTASSDSGRGWDHLTIEAMYPTVFLVLSDRISSMQSSNKIPSLSTSSHVSGMCSCLITPVLSSATEMCLTWRYVSQEVGWVVSFGTRLCCDRKMMSVEWEVEITRTVWGQPSRGSKYDFGFVHFDC